MSGLAPDLSRRTLRLVLGLNLVPPWLVAFDVFRLPICFEDCKNFVFPSNINSLLENIPRCSYDVLTFVTYLQHIFMLFLICSHLCAPACASLYYGKFNSPCGCGMFCLWLCLEGVVCFTWNNASGCAFSHISTEQPANMCFFALDRRPISHEN